MNDTILNKAAAHLNGLEGYPRIDESRISAVAQAYTALGIECHWDMQDGKRVWTCFEI